MANVVKVKVVKSIEKKDSKGGIYYSINLSTGKVEWVDDPIFGKTKKAGSGLEFYWVNGSRQLGAGMEFDLDLDNYDIEESHTDDKVEVDGKTGEEKVVKKGETFLWLRAKG